VEVLAAKLVEVLASKIGKAAAEAFVNSILGADEVSEQQLKAFWENLDPADAVVQALDGYFFGNVMEELVYDFIIPAALKAKWSGIAIARLALVIGDKAGSKAGNLKKTFSALVTNYAVNGVLCLPRNKVCFCKSAPSTQIVGKTPTAKTCAAGPSGKDSFLSGSGGALALAAVVVILAAR
jgi:hypothetical protein